MCVYLCVFVFYSLKTQLLQERLRKSSDQEVCVLLLEWCVCMQLQECASIVCVKLALLRESFSV